MRKLVVTATATVIASVEVGSNLPLQRQPLHTRISEYCAVSLKFVDVKPLLFADLARRRLRSLPPGPPPAELQ
jgi:hypothetical protein